MCLWVHVFDWLPFIGLNDKNTIEKNRKEETASIWLPHVKRQRNSTADRCAQIKVYFPHEITLFIKLDAIDIAIVAVRLVLHTSSFFGLHKLGRAKKGEKKELSKILYQPLITKFSMSV